MRTRDEPHGVHPFVAACRCREAKEGASYPRRAPRDAGKKNQKIAVQAKSPQIGKKLNTTRHTGIMNVFFIDASIAPSARL